jgi:alanine-synthesizing transaminase
VTSNVHYIETLAEYWGEAHLSDWSQAVESAQRSGIRIYDLITASPLENRFDFPREELREILARASASLSSYHPDPRGQFSARRAIADYHGTRVSPNQVILTPGTSVSYFYAFRLLGDPDDEILCPSPTYPLFDDLARLAGLKVRRYHLHTPIAANDAHWLIDPEEVRFQITPRTRALVLVSPHNPIGTVISDGEFSAVGQIAREHDLPIIFDEVFREFVHREEIAVHRPSEFLPPLCITLNGFSKMLALPGIKAGWLVVEGDESRSHEFLNACEYLSDTLLPVSELTQAAIPDLMKSVPRVAATLRARYTERMTAFVQAWQAAGFDVKLPEAGSYLCVPLPERWRGRDESLACDLAREGILLHPGSFYGFDSPWLVSTCILPPPWPVERVSAAAL